MYEVIGYDFEVFKYNWLVVFINKETNEKTVIIDNPTELKDFYIKHKEAVFVGYNSRNYDQFIFKGILCSQNPAEINHELIVNGKRGYSIVPKGKQYPINNYDVSDIQHSLKQLEAFMGHTIKETSVDFTLDRPLTDEEITETVKYCTHDVSECLKVLEYKSGDFEAQFSLIDAFNLPFEMFNMTKAQLSANILGAVKQHTMDDEFEFSIPNTLVLGEKYQFIVDWFKNPKNWAYKTATHSYETGHKRELSCMVAGVPHVFAYGGVHGAIPNYHAKGIILTGDVASLYPSIMIEYGYLSRKLRNPEKYREIRDERLRLKKLKDKKQQPMKIVLNSTYGILKDKNNPLYDPLMSNNVCVTGQLLLLDLIEKVEPHCQLIQSNTDGIYMLVKDMETVELIKNIAHEWEKRTRLELEFDIYNEIYQKDVNNYIIISEDKHYKAKGAYLKKLSPIDNDLPVINRALVEYFVNDTPLADTINNCNSLIEFQKVVKLTNLYKGAVLGEATTVKTADGKDRVSVINAEPLTEKVHRVFASKNPHAKGIFKIKIEKGEQTYEKIANTPEHCFIINDDILNMDIPDELDRKYYIDLAQDRLNQYLESEEEKVNPLPQILFECLQNTNTYYDFLKECAEKSPVKITSKVFFNYIIADCCNKYGKTKKLLDYTKWFESLYNKKNITVKMLDSKYSDIKSLIMQYGTLTKSGKSIDIDSENILLNLWNSIPDEHLPLSEILEKQIELFEDVRYIDEDLPDDLYYVLNTRNEIKPNIITYQLSTGLIEYQKVDKQSFDILFIQDGDIIKVAKSEKRYGYKIVGKDENGINIVEPNSSKIYSYLCNYEIVYRNYKKSNKSLVDEEG